MTGNGNISTEEVFLQGATAYTSNKAVPGKAVNGEIKITSYKQHIADAVSYTHLDVYKRQIMNGRSSS